MLLLLSNTEAPSYEPGMVAGVVDLRPEIIILSLTLLFMLLSSTGALYKADEWKVPVMMSLPVIYWILSRMGSLVLEGIATTTGW